MVTKMIDLIKQYFNPHTVDAVADPRPAAEKRKDYVYGKDIVLAHGGQKKRLANPPIEPLHQGATSACGAYSATHGRILETGEKNNPLVWYRTRTNYPYEGMFTKDVLKLMAKGEVVDSKFASRPFERVANRMPYLDVFNGKRSEEMEYYTISPFDADAVFDAVSNGRPTLISYFCTLREWGMQEMVVRDTTTKSVAPVRHFNMVIPNSNHFKDGYEWVSTLESSPYGGHTMRHIRKDFLQKRMWIGGGFSMPIKKSKTQVTVKATQRCQKGQRNEAVQKLQRMLTQLGYMDERHNTGYYGVITSKAVLLWQLDNLKFDSEKLVQWNGEYWGPLSVSHVLNENN